MRGDRRGDGRRLDEAGGIAGVGRGPLQVGCLLTIAQIVLKGRRDGLPLVHGPLSGKVLPRGGGLSRMVQAFVAHAKASVSPEVTPGLHPPVAGAA